jgi:hypothetical protein
MAVPDASDEAERALTDTFAEFRTSLEEVIDATHYARNPATGDGARGAR